MPGLDLFGSSTPSTANTIVEVVPSAESTSAPAPIQVDEPEKATETAVSVPRGLAGGPAPYYNARLDPKNFLEGPLSWNPATRLRQMLARPGIVVAPGICDGISARCALEAGFDCLYQSGAATTASRLGQPDLAIATLNDFVQSAQMVCSLDPTCPVIADADTGFGGPAMVGRTVTQYARAGVAACHIEDQVQTKRCGHLLGKQVVSREEFVTRIRAAVIARDAIPGGSDFVSLPPFFLLLPSPAPSLLLLPFPVPSPPFHALPPQPPPFRSRDCEIEVRRTHAEPKRSPPSRRSRPSPCSSTSSPAGSRPRLTGGGVAVFSLVSCVAAVHGIRAAMASLKKTGTDFTSAKGMDPKAFFEVMGLNAVVTLDAQAGGKAFEQV
ncbi:hypothetical protein V8D89_003391 [Ganoderma adspersum]